MLAATPAAAAVYAPGGRLLGEGERLRLPDLAETLEHLGRRARTACATGRWPRAIVDAPGRARRARDAPRTCATTGSIERARCAIGYRGRHAAHQPPPSSGRRADRGGAAGDGGAAPRAAATTWRTTAPWPGPGAAANAAARRASSTPTSQEEDCVERLWARRVPRGRRPVAGEPQAHGLTTHISAVDADGGMASLSSSNGSGSGVVVPGRASS